MKKRYSFYVAEETMDLIDQAAAQNNISRSAVIRMFLELINHVPTQSLKLVTPIPALLGIDTEGNLACDS